MRKKTIGAVLALVAILAMCAASSASAATTVGSNCAANTSALGTFISLRNPPGYALPDAIPSSGVITSWSFSLGLPVPFTLSEQLKVFAPTGTTNQFKVVGESAPTVVGTGVTTSQTRIPVQSGDLLGNTVTATIEGKTEQGSVFCETENPGDEGALIVGAPTVGATVSPVEAKPGYQNPITVSVEPDADGDGYGDETQDKCPTNASTHEACPAPPAPITLSATTAAKSGLVIVTLTSSAQASVTVGGKVKVSGSKVKLSGGTQTVTPGTLAKFTVLFPAKLKKQLKKTPTSKKLTLELSASAPGATTKAFKVKVKGQKKAPKKGHKKP